MRSARSSEAALATCAVEAVPANAVAPASTAAGLCERQVLASQQRLQALVATFSDELANARAVGDAREAAYIREKAARSQRLRDKAVASEATRCAPTDHALVPLPDT